MGLPRTIWTALWLNISLPTVTTSPTTFGFGYQPGPNGSVTMRVPLLVVMRKKLWPKYWIVASTFAAYANDVKPRTNSGSRQEDWAKEGTVSIAVRSTSQERTNT